MPKKSPDYLFIARRPLIMTGHDILKTRRISHNDVSQHCLFLSRFLETLAAGAEGPLAFGLLHQFLLDFGICVDRV